jgi:hypothetical protein
MKNILIIILLTSGIKVFAQVDSILTPRTNQMILQQFIEEEFQKNFHSTLRNIGLSGVCYTKFQINSSGQPVNIQVSPGTNDTLAKFLKITLEKTNGYWHNADYVSMRANEYIILPLEYHLYKNGKIMEANTPSNLLLSFFYNRYDTDPVKLIFLRKAECVSPFDSRNSSKKVKFKAVNNNL